MNITDFLEKKKVVRSTIAEITTKVQTLRSEIEENMDSITKENVDLLCSKYKILGFFEGQLNLLQMLEPLFKESFVKEEESKISESEK